MNELKQKRRVLFLFAHLHKGGMQRAVSNISTALPDNFEQYVGFFGTENPGFKYKATLHNFKIEGSRHIRFFGKLFNAWRRINTVSAFVAHNEIDVVVSFGESANVYNILSGHRARKIISSRVALKESLADNFFYGRLYRILVQFIYHRAEKIVTVSEELRQEMLRIVPDQNKVISISNLYDVENIIHLSQDFLPCGFKFLEGKRFVLNVGSLCYQKGQDDLLNIFADVSRKYDDLLLVILGRGECKDQLVEQASTLGISDKVVFIDFDANPFRYMARAAMFVLTSRFEGFPNVLVEAMACGCPVVALDCPTGPQEILGNSDFGILVRERSLEQASHSISNLLDDNNLHSSFKSLASQRARFYSAENVIEKWVQIMS